MKTPKSTDLRKRPFANLPAKEYEGKIGSMTLADGRKITWHAYGRKHGFPVFYFHGTPGSGVEAAVFARAARKNHCRVIGINRPGIGDSDFQPDRKVAQWPDDVRQVADHLGYEEFSVLGWSGGGPHALVTGAELKDRVRAVGLISPQGRYDPNKGKLDKSLSRVWMPALKVLAETPNLGRRLIGAAFRYSDQHRHRRSDTSMYENIFARSLQNSQKNHTRGTIHDNDALLEDWGISMAQIAADLEKASPPIPVTIWQGLKDIYVNPTATKKMAAELPESTIIIDPFASHLEELLDHTDNVMRLMKRTREEAAKSDQ